MNEQLHIVAKSQSVFSRWSRKAYAIFASLHKQIKIAKLRADIFDIPFFKLSYVDLPKMVEETEEEEDKEELNTNSFIYLLSSIFLERGIDNAFLNSIYLFYCSPERFVLFGLFYFKKYEND